MAGHLALIGQHSLRSLNNSRKEKKKLAFFILLSDADHELPAAVFEVCVCSCRRTYESYKDNCTNVEWKLTDKITDIRPNILIKHITVLPLIVSRATTLSLNPNQQLSYAAFGGSKFKRPAVVKMYNAAKFFWQEVICKWRQTVFDVATWECSRSEVTFNHRKRSKRCQISKNCRLLDYNFTISFLTN